MIRHPHCATPFDRLPPLPDRFPPVYTHEHIPRKASFVSRKLIMIESPLSSPAKVEHHFRKVAILFAGGPAPAANAVISTAAVSFLRNDIEVVGVLNGYSHLVEYSEDRPLVAGRDYVMVDHKLLRRTRNSQGIMIGTARTNPGRDISHPSHLDDPARVHRCEPFTRRCVRLRSMPCLDRRRRHAQVGQQVQAVSGPPAGRRQADSRRPPAQDDRQRLHGASTSRSATSRPSIRLPAKFATCWPTPKRTGPIT